jgi:hypothetical protein
MSDLPVWSEKFGRKFLEVINEAAAVSVDANGFVCWHEHLPSSVGQVDWRVGGIAGHYLGRVALPEGANWRDCIAVRKPEKPPEPPGVPPTAADVGKQVYVRDSEDQPWGAEPRTLYGVNFDATFPFWADTIAWPYAKLAEPPTAEPEPPAVAHAELPAWVEAMLGRFRLDGGEVDWLSRYGRILNDDLGLTERVDLCDLVGLLIEEVERRRRRAEIAEAQAARLSDTCAESLKQANDDLDRLRSQSELKSRVIGRLPLCPDHRDKVRDTCCWCEVERLRAQLADLPHNADCDLVLPPCHMWVVYRPTGSAAWVGRFYVDGVERGRRSDQWKARSYSVPGGDLADVADLYSSEASARKAAEARG